jgi:branched-chain amino acid transport system substrate-binding protein
MNGAHCQSVYQSGSRWHSGWEEQQMLCHLLYRSIACVAAAIVAAAIACWPATAAEPIRIGFGMALTGPLAANGKSALLAMKIWEEDVNAKGGLLGRPVKLIYYDDQSTPANVPGIYAKLLDIDKVELIMGGYGTNMVAPAMPIAIKRKKLLIGLFPVAVNAQFNYPRYFAMNPLGPEPKTAVTKAFFDVAMAQNPKPQTIAIVGADAEYAQSAAEGARENAKAAGLKIVYNRTYPPATTDFAPIVRAMQATNPDIVVVCSYPLDTAGMVRAVNEVGFKPKMIGGAMVGLQATAFKTQLGPLLNGFVDYDFWIPLKTMEFPGVLDLIKKYQARAQAEGVDPLGYYTPPFAYAYLQVLGQAVAATKSLDDGKLADYIHTATFATVVGDIKFGRLGDWAQSRVLQVQFQNVTGNSIDQFKNLSVEVIVAPAQYKSGNVIYPYADAKK